MGKKFLGGFAIGLGCMAYLSVENRYLGAFLFQIGLLTICSRGWELFTGKLCTSNSVEELFATWCFNVVGICIAAIFFAGGCGTWWAFSEAKFSRGLIPCFYSAVLCEVCIYIAVIGYKKIQSDIGKNLSVILGVVVFILCGFEHCIADIFYLLMHVNLHSALFVLMATIGNIAGAVLMREVDV